MSQRRPSPVPPSDRPAPAADRSRPSRPAHTRRGVLPDRARMVLAVGGIVGLGAVLTSAAFSDSAEVTAGFTAGTLDITVDGEQGNPVPYELVFAGADRIAPGDVVYSPLEVANVGDVDAELSLTTTSTRDPLGPDTPDAQLLTMVPTVGTACDAGVVAAATSPYADDVPLDGASFTGVPLAGSDAVDLCIAVSLPSSVVGTGGGTAEVTFDVLAEQADV